MRDGFNPGYLEWKLRTGYRTDIERLTESVLIALGVHYVFEKKIGRYFADFFLPDLDVVLECDGWQHRTRAGQSKDKKKDAYLRSRGLKVKRIRDKSIRTNAKKAVLRAIGKLLAPTAS